MWLTRPAATCAGMIVVARSPCGNPPPPESGAGAGVPLLSQRNDGEVQDSAALEHLPSFVTAGLGYPSLTVHIQGWSRSSHGTRPRPNRHQCIDRGADPLPFTDGVFRATGPRDENGPGFLIDVPISTADPTVLDRPEWQVTTGTGRCGGVDGLGTGSRVSHLATGAGISRPPRTRPGAASALSGSGRRAAHECAGRPGSFDEDNIDENSAEHFSAAPAHSRSGGLSERGPSQLRRARVRGASAAGADLRAHARPPGFHASSPPEEGVLIDGGGPGAPPWKIRGRAGPPAAGVSFDPAEPAIRSSLSARPGRAGRVPRSEAASTRLPRERGECRDRKGRGAGRRGATVGARAPLVRGSSSSAGRLEKGGAIGGPRGQARERVRWRLPRGRGAGGAWAWRNDRFRRTTHHHERRGHA
jgi:hypothetical protein